MTFHVCKVMTQVTGQRAHPHTRSPQSFNRNITDSILNRGYKYRVQSHAQIQEFFPGGGGGGGGGPGPTVRKQLFIFSPQHCM